MSLSQETIPCHRLIENYVQLCSIILKQVVLIEELLKYIFIKITSFEESDSAQTFLLQNLVLNDIRNSHEDSSDTGELRKRKLYLVICEYWK